MGAYDRYQLKLGPKTGSRTAPLVKEWADMVLFINYKTFSVATDKEGKKNKAQGGSRTVYATHHPAWDAKNRHGLPDEFPLDYRQIAHIFTGNAAAAQVTPPAAVTPPPQSAPEPAPAAPPTPPPADAELNPNIPRSLRDLMAQYQVKEWEIQKVVGQRGYYPEDTPITNYDPGFIDGVLVTAWPKVLGFVEELRKSIPFQ